MTPSQSGEFSIGEYLGFARRHPWLIVIMALIGAAGGLGISAAQKKKYTATAVVAVGDPNQTNGVVGVGSLNTQSPLQLSSTYVPLVTRPAVVARVRQLTGTTLSTIALQDSVAVTIDPNSYALDLTVTSTHAEDAAKIANAFAQADSELTTASARQAYKLQATAVQKKLKHAPQSVQLLEQETLARLEQLATVDQPLQVNQLAAVPGSPSSPKPARNTIIGLVLGLLLGLAGAIGRDSLDRRMRKPSDVTDELGHPIVGQIPPTALGTPRKLSRRGGAVELLSLRDQEAFRILRQNVGFLSGNGGQIILVTSAMPQEGKSSVSAGLALAMAQAGKRTLLVDCDLRKPVVAERMGLRQSPGLTDYLTGNAEPASILQRISSTKFSLNGSTPQDGVPGAVDLVCIASGTHALLPAELLAADQFREFLTEVAQVYDVVVLDTAPLLTIADTLGILPDVSAVLMCVRLDRTTRDQVRAAQSALDRLPSRPTALVLTDVKHQPAGYYGYYYSSQTGKREHAPHH